MIKKIEIPSMKREERKNVMQCIKRGYTLTINEVTEATNLSKDDILRKLESIGYIKPWIKNPTYKFAAVGTEQPVPYSVSSYKYTRGGIKNYGSDVLWLFKPHVVDILLNKAPTIGGPETLYILTEDEYNTLSASNNK